MSLSASNGITHVENVAPFAFYYDDNPKLRRVVTVYGAYTYSAFSDTLPSGEGDKSPTKQFTLAIVK